MYTDTWSDLSINGVSLNERELEFIVKPSSEYYNIGDNEEFPI
jgi:hypothetical protein